MSHDPSGRAAQNPTALPESAESALQRADRLREKAAELRAVSETMTDGPSRMSLLCLAEDYEKLSEYAHQRAELARRFRSRMTG
jgi:hypothetical protein